MRLVLFLWLSLSVHVAWATETILVLGDSISAAYGIPYDSGWVSQLQTRLKKTGYAHEVVNASISGETTAGGRQRLPALLDRYLPGVLIIELGGNDGLRGLSLNQVQKNLAEMVAVAKSRKVRVLLLGMRLPPNYGPHYNLGFTRLFESIALSEGVALVPFLLQGFATDPNMMQDDGIHPREEAQSLMVNLVWPKLETLIQ